MSQPLIATLLIDKAAAAYYEDLRQRYFPAERNQIPAHLTLFHHLPDEELTYTRIQESADASAVFSLSDPALRLIGRGVAVFFRSEALLALHAALATAFAAELIPQDRQRFQPHIVVQNKVLPEIARRTLAEMGGHAFVAPQALGITLWRYLGGPWEPLEDFCFSPVRI